jgi:hypothetical protein
MRRWKPSTADRWDQKQASLPTTPYCLALHPGGRHRLRGTRNVYSPGAGVDDGDSIANPCRCRLMQLEGCRLALIRRNVRVRIGVQRKLRVRSHLVRLRTGLRRAAGQRRPVGRRGNGNHIGLGEKVWTELHIIIQIKGPPRLKALSEIRHHSGLFFFPYVAKWFVSSQAWRSAPTATVVGRRGRLRIRSGRMLMVIMVEGRHGS